jgi:hypothetical protein
MNLKKFYRILVVGSGLILPALAACSTSTDNGTTGGSTTGQGITTTTAGGTTGSACTAWASHY